MGNPPGDGKTQTSPFVSLVPMILIFVIFYFILIRPQQQKAKQQQEMLKTVKAGDKVVTTSGIYGQITRLNEKSVQVQIADKVRIEVARSAVGGYQGQEPVVADSGNV